MLWFAIERSEYLHASLRDVRGRGPPGAPARARRGRAGASRRSRPRASRPCCTTRPGGVLHARRATLGMARLAAAAGATLREGVAVRSVGDGVVELADGTREQADSCSSPPAPGRRAWSPTRPIRSTQQVNVYLRIATPGLPVWTFDLDVFGLSDDGGAGLKVGGHAIGATSTPTIRRPAWRRRPRWSGSPTPRRVRLPGPAVAQRGRRAAGRRRLLLCAHADRGPDRRPPRRAHGRVRRLLGPRLQVRADGRGGRGRPGARAARPRSTSAPFRFPRA